MAKIKRANEVTKAIRTVSREVKLAIKEVNEAAANQLARGHYEGAQELIDVAKAMSEFATDLTGLQSKWRELRGSKQRAKNEKPEQTPLWEFYRPILKALLALGGEGARKEIEAKLEGQVDGWLKAGDFAKNSRGIPRWKTMIRRARKPMIAEGFLSNKNQLRWIITDKGEQVTKSTKAGK